VIVPSSQPTPPPPHTKSRGPGIRLKHAATHWRSPPQYSPCRSLRALMKPPLVSRNFQHRRHRLRTNCPVPPSRRHDRGAFPRPLAVQSPWQPTCVRAVDSPSSPATSSSAAARSLEVLPRALPSWTRTQTPDTSPLGPCTHPHHPCAFVVGKALIPHCAGWSGDPQARFGSQQLPHIKLPPCSARRPHCSLRP